MYCFIVGHLGFGCGFCAAFLLQHFHVDICGLCATHRSMLSCTDARRTQMRQAVRCRCRLIFSYASSKHYFINASACQLWRPVPAERGEAGCQFPKGGATCGNTQSFTPPPCHKPAFRGSGVRKHSQTVKDDANSQTENGPPPTDPPADWVGEWVGVEKF